MVVGTHAAVRALTMDQVRATGTQVVLANTYHLLLRDRFEVIQKLGGLHDFMGWESTVLTDSGGFQVYSLPKKEITDRGVRFRNEHDGKEVELTPERSVEIQNALGADIIMAFDECTPYPATERDARRGVRRTLGWLERSRKAHQRAHEQALFGIVQGSTFAHLRSSCVEGVTAADLPGYAIGGVSVGEGHDLLCEITRHTAPLLPEDKPRYLMGVGLPEDLLAAISFGVDLFDCVIPTRYARSASVFTRRGRLRLTHRRFRRDRFPIDPSCSCAACAGGVTRAYLHHLFAANEILSAVLASIHNVHFYQQLMADARTAIAAGDYKAFREDFLGAYQSQNTSS
jgi:queuine tRNA-ribosyltransferase